jgi:hypothetical protein
MMLSSVNIEFLRIRGQSPQPMNRRLTRLMVCKKESLTRPVISRKRDSCPAARIAIRSPEANGSQREIPAFESLEHFRIAPRRRAAV